ncbi:hypothetical protein PGANDO_1232, partial [Porphyromonas gingivalis]
LMAKIPILLFQGQ